RMLGKFGQHRQRRFRVLERFAPVADDPVMARQAAQRMAFLELAPELAPDGELLLAPGNRVGIASHEVQLVAVLPEQLAAARRITEASASSTSASAHGPRASTSQFSMRPGSSATSSSSARVPALCRATRVFTASRTVGGSPPASRSSVT